MNTNSLRILAFLLILLIFNGCQKEYSIENLNRHGTAQGTLVDSLGDCKSAVIFGNYHMDTALTSMNYVLVNVNFTSTGKYFISTDTVNGMWFVDSGYALLTGPAAIKLKGYGKPILPIITTFIVTFNNEHCSFTISKGLAEDYLPTTAGSFWEFQYLPSLIGAGGAPLNNFKVSVAPDAFPYNGKVYYQYATNFLDTFLFAKDRGIYYEYGTPDFDYTGIFDEVGSFFEYPYLNENLKVGDTWESPLCAVTFGQFLGNPSKLGRAKIKFTILTKGQNYSIAGKTVPNTITVKREIYFQADGTSTFKLILNGTVAYAKGIGMIDQNINLPDGSVQKTPASNWKIY
jgi:hypothetical protein